MAEEEEIGEPRKEADKVYFSSDSREMAARMYIRLPTMRHWSETGLGWLRKLRLVSKEDPDARFEGLHKVMLYSDLYENANRRMKLEMRIHDAVQVQVGLPFDMAKLRQDILADNVVFTPRAGEGTVKKKKTWVQLRADVAARGSRMPSTADVVLRVMADILEAVFEPVLSNWNHGYRSDRTPHTCLFEVRNNNRDITYALDGDLLPSFEAIDRVRLLDKLRSKIDDEIFINTVIRAMGAGHLHWRPQPISLLGVPEPIGFSGILSNIYFDDFDRDLGALNAGELSEELAANPEPPRETTDSIQQRVENAIESDPIPASYQKRSVNYYRYANKVFIVIQGRRRLAELVHLRTEEIAARHGVVDAEWSLSNRVIGTGRSKMRVRGLSTFLGVHIYCKLSETKTRGWMRQAAGGFLMVRVMKRAGFCDGTGRPMARFQWYHHDKDTIVKLHSGTTNRLLEYYAFVDNFSACAQALLYTMRSSCAKLLAAKHKLRSRAKVYKRWGRDLGGDKGPDYAFDVRTSTERPSGHFQPPEFFRLPNQWFR